MPALAVAERLRAAGAEVVFVGGERAEAELVPAAGYELRTIRVEGLSRTNPLRAARALLRAGAAVGAASRILAELRPAAVLGGGGYVAGPVGLAALARRIPLVLTEADSHLGITNRLLAPRARRVCLAFPIEGRDGPRYRRDRAPGAPAGDRRRRRPRALRPRATGAHACSSSAARSARGRSTRPPSRRFAPRPSASCTPPATRDHAALAPRVDGEHYDLRPYIDDFGEALAACDLCVARAGGSIFEIAAAGKPAILVPYPYASADHQTANARWMARRGRGGRRARRRADGGAPGHRGRRAARRPVAAGGDGGARRRRWPGPTRRRRSPTSARRRAAERAAVAMSAALGGPAAALRRHRRGGDERPGADRRRARRDGHRLGPGARPTSSACARPGSRRSSATTPPTCRRRRRRARRLDGDRRARTPSARRRASAGCARSTAARCSAS